MVNSWIEWTRKNINIAEGYPKVTSLAITGHPWNDERKNIAKFENQQFRHAQLLAAFTAAVAPDAADLAPRFTAIHYYYTLSCEANDLIKDPVRANAIEYYDESELESLTRAFEQDLALLVGALSMENVPVDWRIMQWEILNSYLIRDWNRALELYNKAAEVEVLELWKLFLLRGQFRFLRVFFSKVMPHEGTGLESLAWEPRVYGVDSELDVWEWKAIAEELGKEGNSQKPRQRTPEQWDKYIRGIYYCYYSLFLLNYSCCANYPIQPISDSGERGWLIDAAADLKKALEGGKDLPTVYDAVVGMCYFLRGEFVEAAEHYLRLLDRSGTNVLASPNRLQIFKSLALCYERATQTEKAIEVLQKCATEFPKGEIHLEIARLQSQQFTMTSVTDSIVRAIKLNPELSSDWKLTALKWMGTSYTTESLLEDVQKMHKVDPKTHELVEKMLCHYWEQFSRMTEEAKRLWVGGTYDVYYIRLMEPSQKFTRFGSAARFFTQALELELCEKVFAGFRDHVQQKGLHKIIEQGLSSKGSERLCNYLMRRGKLTLGEMVIALKRSLSSREQIMEEFRRWWREKNYPGLHKKLETLKMILPDRRDATHHWIAIENAGQVPSRCKRS